MQIKRTRKTGAQRRAERVAAGLPRYSEREAAADAARTKRRAAEKQLRNRDFIASIKLDRGCADCGFREHPAALEFDHLPGASKTASLASLSSRASRTVILAEIAKCEVVCANCHRIRTYERGPQKMRVSLEAAGGSPHA